MPSLSLCLSRYLTLTLSFGIILLPNSHKPSDGSRHDTEAFLPRFGVNVMNKATNLPPSTSGDYRDDGQVLAILSSIFSSNTKALRAKTKVIENHRRE